MAGDIHPIFPGVRMGDRNTEATTSSIRFPSASRIQPWTRVFPGLWSRVFAEEKQRDTSSMLPCPEIRIIARALSAIAVAWATMGAESP